jgi:predicted transcriptional regulator
MALKGKKSVASQVKSVDLSSISKATPYIQRVIQDATLRENVRTAYDSTRSAYARLTNGKAPAKALLEDKKLQRDLQNAVEALKEASNALAEAPKKQAPKKRGGFVRKIMIASLAFGLALAGSEKLRTKVLDMVFGKEEEFEYTPPPATASTPPSSPVGAA